jgi:hypothetical protein
MNVTGGVVAAAGRRTGPIPGWLPAVAVLVGGALAGPLLGGASRFAFIAGCGAAGWYAWRRGPAAHLQAALLLFAFAPLVRRLVDVSIGYDQTGIMLVGPLLALLAPLPRLHLLIDRERLPRQMGPILVVAACVAYATALSAFQGDWMNAASGALKWFVPLIYAAALAESTDPDELVRAAAAVFLVILPVTGLYGSTSTRRDGTATG